ncbi:hypothetical protein [Oceanobacillus polygoni]|uniref:Uncharacterized protein n=1 Tax=Oceanobacillus polygoni TaxID=1235259 RepID=A0A9X0YTA0_9BACI|nr:hypothetical protein [Oceanobacillus polygoni]MBP2078518.1 hypothetical protein [Oceanobacillus polygoni]
MAGDRISSDFFAELAEVVKENEEQIQIFSEIDTKSHFSLKYFTNPIDTNGILL